MVGGVSIGSARKEDCDSLLRRLYGWMTDMLENSRIAELYVILDLFTKGSVMEANRRQNE